MKTKWFHRSWQIFLKYGPGLLIASFIFWGFVILYKQNNWIGISALATLFLALAAFLAIRQTRETQKSEKKERLLNEIIEWAEDIRKSSLESTDPNRINLGDPTMQIEPLQMQFFRLWRRYQGINTKGTYIKAIAKNFGGNLLSVTESIIYKLDEIIEVLNSCLYNSKRASREEKSEKVEAHKKALDSCAEDLIKEATKIKTREIS